MIHPLLFILKREGERMPRMKTKEQKTNRQKVKKEEEEEEWERERGRNSLQILCAIFFFGSLVCQLVFSPLWVIFRRASGGLCLTN